MQKRCSCIKFSLPIIEYTLSAPFITARRNRLAPVDPKFNFDCPECEEQLSVPRQHIGDQIHCNYCGENIHVPAPLSAKDKLVAGMLDDDDFEHPGALKIDGISDDADDGSSWHIKCQICDSTLLVTQQQVGKKVKCNDCYSMINVLPNAAAAKLAATVKDGSDLEIVEEKTSSKSASIPDPPNDSKVDIDSNELTLAPALELAPEITNAQKETFLEELVEEDPPELTAEHLVEEEDPIELEEPIELENPVTLSNVNPMFGLDAPNGSELDNDDDSDEMIEILDMSPEELNQPASFAAPVAPVPTELPRMPRKKGKQPNSIPVESDDEEKPIRVHAKRRPKRKQTASSIPTPVQNGFQFEDASLNEVLEKAVGVLKTGNIWIWSLVSIVVMAIGSSAWHWISPPPFNAEVALVSKLISWALGSVFGLGIFFAGFAILYFACGVIFRETAQGNTKVESVPVANSADFTSTMLLFGFSMTIAALPCMLFGFVWLSLIVQFLLAGCFLFAAWENQGPFSIISANIFSSFSQQSQSWKKWLICTAIAIGGGLTGGLLLEVYWPIVSILASIAGSFLVVASTLFYATVTGWHCGNVVEKRRQADE